MHVRKVSKTEEEINDRKDNPEVELDDSSTVSVVTNRMAEFQAMIDASIIKAESQSVGLMESTKLTWEQQFEIGGPFTFNEKDGE